MWVSLRGGVLGAAWGYASQCPDHCNCPMRQRLAPMMRGGAGTSEWQDRRRRGECASRAELPTRLPALRLHWITSPRTPSLPVCTAAHSKCAPARPPVGHTEALTRATVGSRSSHDGGAGARACLTGPLDGLLGPPGRCRGRLQWGEAIAGTHPLVGAPPAPSPAAPRLPGPPAAAHRCLLCSPSHHLTLAAATHQGVHHRVGARGPHRRHLRGARGAAAHHAGGLDGKRHRRRWPADHHPRGGELPGLPRGHPGACRWRWVLQRRRGRRACDDAACAAAAAAAAAPAAASTLQPPWRRLCAVPRRRAVKSATSSGRRALGLAPKSSARPSRGWTCRPAPSTSSPVRAGCCLCWLLAAGCCLARSKGGPSARHAACCAMAALSAGRAPPPAMRSAPCMPPALPPCPARRPAPPQTRRRLWRTPSSLPRARWRGGCPSLGRMRRMGFGTRASPPARWVARQLPRGTSRPRLVCAAEQHCAAAARCLNLRSPTPWAAGV